MALEFIFATFKRIQSIADKIKYLEWLRDQGTGYDINFDNLIKNWEAKIK